MILAAICVLLAISGVVLAGLGIIMAPPFMAIWLPGRMFLRLFQGEKGGVLSTD